MKDEIKIPFVEEMIRMIGGLNATHVDSVFNNYLVSIHIITLIFSPNSFAIHCFQGNG